MANRATKLPYVNKLVEEMTRNGHDRIIQLKY